MIAYNFRWVRRVAMSIQSKLLGMLLALTEADLRDLRLLRQKLKEAGGDQEAGRIEALIRAHAARQDQLSALLRDGKSAT